MKLEITLPEHFEKLIKNTVEETVLDVLPTAIRKATRPKWITTSQVMEILQCSRRHVQHLRDSGRLEFRQVRRTVRYDIDEVEAYLNRGKVKSQQ